MIGCQISYIKNQISHFVFRILDFGFLNLDLRFEILYFRCQIPSIRMRNADAGFGISDLAIQRSEFKFQITGLQIYDFAITFETPSTRLWNSDFVGEVFSDYRPSDI